MKSFELRQIPSPSNSAHEPNDQLRAPGGLEQTMRAALQFHSTQFAAAQPAPPRLGPRLPSVSAWPSIRTLSNSTPDAQLSSGPLSRNGWLASHCTKAFGPAAQ